MKNKNGFTLIELVIVILVLGILAAVAVPKFVDFATNARKASAEATIGAVKEGLANYIAESYVTNRTPRWPSQLDNAPVGNASDTAPFFTIVLQNGVTDPKWEKTSPGGAFYYYYEYYNANGSWKKVFFYYTVGTGVISGPFYQSG